MRTIELATAPQIWPPRKYLTAFNCVTVAFAIALLILAALHFPYDTDAPLSAEEIAATQNYYDQAYRKPAAAESHAQSQRDAEYALVAAIEAKTFRIEDQVRDFAARYGLAEKPVLEIGSGRGNLQNIVPDYTGLDISATAARYYHKKFVIGSATALPFPDNAFVAVWSIWVFEHVPNPEQAFSEARRVTRDGGVMFLLPGWNSTSWAAEGYQVRPYSDFGLAGKIIKASLPLRSAAAFQAAILLPIRAVRSAAAAVGPTRLRYRRLTPNYQQYWVNDSDAVNSIDSHEALMWFLSRGDECLNCQSAKLLMGFGPLIIRVNKAI